VRTTRYDLDRDGWSALLDGEARFRLEQVWNGLFHQGRDLEDLTELPKPLRARLAAATPTALSLVTESVSDGGDTVKFLWELEGGARVETVLMHYRDRTTVCLSTQAGCAMACSFCATGQAGFERQLGVGEIVEQLVRARQHAARRRDPRRVSNVVFMGMGEPLANYEHTWAAIRRIHGDMEIGARHLTVSTVGVVPGIRRMATEDLPVNLAVSLHAADDELRDRLVPINRRYPIEALMEACEAYLAATRRRVSFEWALIDGVNDRPQDVEGLARLARRVRAHVNLIPLNPTPGYPVRGSSPVRVRAVRDELSRLGVNVTVRDTRGTDIDAACGQLRAGHAATPLPGPRRR
jgi:23S rRNA (adenine2503-C2)-methyltransferase